MLRAAIDKCRDTDQFVVERPHRSQQDRIVSPRAANVHPVYRDFRSVHTVAERRTHLDGLLVGLCQLDDLVNCASNYANGPQGIDVALFDKLSPGRDRLLYFHTSRTREKPDAIPTRAAELDPAGIHYTAALECGGRRWSLVCTPAPYFFSARETWRSWTLLAIGLLVTGCSAGYTWSVTTRTERIQRLVDQRTAELRKKDDQLRQSQKLEAVGSLAGGIAHEFNNLLQAIGGYTRYAMEGLKPEEQPHQDLQNVLEAADRATALTRQLLSFSRRQTVERKECGANQMVADVTKMLRPLLGEQIQLKVILGPDVGTIFADAGSFQQVLLNLCLNARDAMPTGGPDRGQDGAGRRFAGLCRVVYELEARRLRRIERGRHRVSGMTAERARADFRAVFHHQAGRQGHGARLVDGLRHRANSTKARSTSTASRTRARRSRSTCRSSRPPTAQPTAAPDVDAVRRRRNDPRGRGRSDGPRRGAANSGKEPATRCLPPPMATRP